MGVLRWRLQLLPPLGPAGREARSRRAGVPVCAQEGRDVSIAGGRERREALPPSILVLTREERILTRSSAVLHILEQLGGGWRAMSVVGRFVPAGIRDVVYQFIAHVRHGLLPAPESVCPVVAPEFRARFGP